MKAALLSTAGKVVNYIVVDSEDWVLNNLPEYADPSRYVIIEENTFVNIGQTYVDGQFVDPEPETPPEE